MKNEVSVFWFRRDLRLEDNVGLFQALSSQKSVLPIFIFDRNILDQLDNKKDRRVDYIHQVLSTINNELKVFNARLNTFYGDPIKIFKMLSEEYDLQAVFCNQDYEPQALKRDLEIYKLLKEQNI